jgi:Fe2+ or Zn2+ uptake regulation protein
MTNQIIEKLREKGVKVTPQRIAIINYLQNNLNHPDVEEIYNHVLEEYPTISLATIYNTLDKLEEINEVVKLKITDDNKVNYDYKKKPLHHFYCKKCGNIFDVDIVCDYAKMLVVQGHKIDEVHGYFKGICSKCNKK